MLNLELECRLLMQRMEELRSRAERRSLLRAARISRGERRSAEIARIRPVSDLRKVRG
jgi:hypothetical protein